MITEASRRSERRENSSNFGIDPLMRLNVTTSKGGRQSIPCAGYRNGSSVSDVGTNGNCWSCTPNESNSDNAYNLNFNASNANVNNNNRYNGYSVRLVSVQLPLRFEIS